MHTTSGGFPDGHIGDQHPHQAAQATYVKYLRFRWSITPSDFPNSKTSMLETMRAGKSVGNRFLKHSNFSEKKVFEVRIIDFPSLVKFNLNDQTNYTFFSS